jgi:hypothetical protein
VGSRIEQRFDLGDASVDSDDLRRPLRQQVVAEPAAPVHLDEQAAQVAQRILACLQEGAALAPEQACMGAPRSDTVGAVPAKKRGHPASLTRGSYDAAAYS